MMKWMAALLFAFALAARQFHPGVMHRALENTIVVRPCRGNHMVRGRFG